MTARRFTNGSTSLTAQGWATLLGVSRQRVYQLVEGDTIRMPGTAVPRKEKTGGATERRKSAERRIRAWRQAHPGAKQYTCGACGGVGHNRRSCTSAAMADT